MTEKVCVLCGQTYLIAPAGDTPLCHNCYCTLFDKTKPLSDKIKYLQKVNSDLKAIRLDK